MFTFESIVSNLDSKVWAGHVNVPADIVLELKKRNISRLVCTFNGQETSHTSLMGHGDGTYFILLNKERCKKLGLAHGSPVSISLEEDKSTYGMPMPEELGELLKQDTAADKYFHALTPGYQRNLIYLVTKPKGPETRLKKAIGICEYLKSVNGALDFKELHQALKESRFKL